MGMGRLEIFTDEPYIDSGNVIRVLQNAMTKHRVNAERCNFLIDYEEGKQPLKRVKTYRPDIDIKMSDNIANEITEFKLGYNWNSPTTLVRRGERDSGAEDEAKSILLLNECYRAEKNDAKTQQLARFVEITGIGYTYIDINTEYEDGDSFFTLNVLDPRTAFVVRSSYYTDRRIMLGVSFREDDMGNQYFTCFTKDQRFEISGVLKITNGKTEQDENGSTVRDWFERKRSGEINLIGIQPITEWIRNYDRMGCFERQIAEMDGLNIAISDFVNDVDSMCQAVWWSNDVEFPKDEEGNIVKPKAGEWMQTFTPPDGKTPMVNPLSIQYDYTGMLEQIKYRADRIREKCNVPNRNSTSGGSTGLAIDSASGWSGADIEASKQDLIKDGCKMEEVKVALAAIRKSPYVPSDSPLLSLRYSDIRPSVSRQKRFELVNKINAYSTGIAHGLAPQHLIDAINLFPDSQQVISDSMPYINRYLDSAFSTDKNTGIKSNKDRMEQDNSDQTENSPLLDSDRG